MAAILSISATKTRAARAVNGGAGSSSTITIDGPEAAAIWAIAQYLSGEDYDSGRSTKGFYKNPSTGNVSVTFTVNSGPNAGKNFKSVFYHTGQGHLDRNGLLPVSNRAV